MQNKILFSRLDKFLTRCHELINLCNTTQQYNTTQHISIGSTNGHILTHSLKTIYNEYCISISCFKSVGKLLCVENTIQYETLYFKYKTKLKELDNRLNNVFKKAWDECCVVLYKFKLIETFGELIKRPILENELKINENEIIKHIEIELNVVSELFKNNTTQYNKNLPPVSASVVWCRGLITRIKTPFELLRKKNTTQHNNLIKKYTSLLAQLNDYINDKWREWESSVEEHILVKLKNNLLYYKTETQHNTTQHNTIEQNTTQQNTTQHNTTQQQNKTQHSTTQHNTTQHLEVNFDPLLVELLRETKYLKNLNIKIPLAAQSVSEKANKLIQYVNSLELITTQHNTTQHNLLPVERGLLTDQLEELKNVLYQGCVVLTWKSSGVDGYIHNTTQQLDKLHNTIQHIKSTNIMLGNFTNQWIQTPLVTKPFFPTVLNFTDLQSHYTKQLNSKLNIIKINSNELNKNINTTLLCLNMAETLPCWKRFLEWINHRVIESLALVLCHSIQHLVDLTKNTTQHNTTQHNTTQYNQHLTQTETTKNTTQHNQNQTQTETTKNTTQHNTTEVVPFVKMKVYLLNHNLFCEPKINEIKIFFKMWTEQFFKIGVVFKRVCGNGSYVKELEQYDKVSCVVLCCVLLGAFL